MPHKYSMRGGVNFPGKSVTKVYGSMLLALRGGGCQFSNKKRYVIQSRMAGNEHLLKYSFWCNDS